MPTVEYRTEIKRLRLRKRMTLSALAATIGISPAYLSQIESGKHVPSESVNAKIVATLGESDAEARSLYALYEVAKPDETNLRPFEKSGSILNALLKKAGLYRNALDPICGLSASAVGLCLYGQMTPAVEKVERLTTALEIAGIPREHVDRFRRQRWLDVIMQDSRLSDASSEERELLLKILSSNLLDPLPKQDFEAIAIPAKLSTAIKRKSKNRSKSKNESPLLFLTEKQTAAKLNVSRQTLFANRVSGNIKAHKIGASIRYAIDDINAFDERRRSKKNKTSTGSPSTQSIAAAIEC